MLNSVQFSCSVMSDSLPPHESQHARPPCPSPTPRVHPNSCASSWSYHPAISSSVVPFSSCPQSLPASGSFPVSQIFESRGQSIGALASASVLPMNIHSKVKISFKIHTSNRCPRGCKESDVTEWLNWTEQMPRNKSKKVANLLQILITMDKLLYGWHIPYQWIGYPNITKILISRNI